MAGHIPILGPGGDSTVPADTAATERGSADPASAPPAPSTGRAPTGTGPATGRCRLRTPTSPPSTARPGRADAAG